MVEFYIDGQNVLCKGDEGVSYLTEKSPLVDRLNERICELYPQADSALRDCYIKSISNPTYYNYLRARRFCKCNFGRLDNTKMDVVEGGFNIEYVPCPLRGECKYEGVICLPKMDTNLSEAEYRVMKLVNEGMTNEEIAEELYLSPNTVKRHIATSYIKLGVRNRAEFIKYANDNNIFV